ncbi:MAG: hypothetical protein AB1649_05830 [Chloroflexota bacterium]
MVEALVFWNIVKQTYWGNNSILVEPTKADGLLINYCQLKSAAKSGDIDWLNKALSEFIEVYVVTEGDDQAFIKREGKRAA